MTAFYQRFKGKEPVFCFTNYCYLIVPLCRVFLNLELKFTLSMSKSLGEVKLILC